MLGNQMCKFNYVSKIGRNLLAGAQLNMVILEFCLVIFEEFRSVVV